MEDRQTFSDYLEERGYTITYYRHRTMEKGSAQHSMYDSEQPPCEQLDILGEALKLANVDLSLYRDVAYEATEHPSPESDHQIDTKLSHIHNERVDPDELVSSHSRS